MRVGARGSGSVGWFTRDDAYRVAHAGWRTRGGTHGSRRMRWGARDGRKWGGGACLGAGTHLRRTARGRIVLAVTPMPARFVCERSPVLRTQHGTKV